MPSGAGCATLRCMPWSPDPEAVRRHPRAAAALQRGDAVRALAHVEGADDPAGLRLIGRALLVLGDRAGARRALARALVLDDHPEAFLAHEALAGVARAEGEPATAVRHLRAALATAPADATVALHREAALLAYRDGALEVAAEHAAAVVHAAGAGPTLSATAAHDEARLGVIRSEQGRHQEAVAHLRAAEAALERIYGPTDDDVLAVRSELADALRDAGDADGAEAACRSVADGLELTGAPATQLAAAWLALGELLRLRGALDEATALARRAQEHLTTQVGADHPLRRRAVQLSGPD